MMFPKQNMLSQYPQQLLTEINAIPVISQLPFPWLAAVTKMPKNYLRLQLRGCQSICGAFSLAVRPYGLPGNARALRSLPVSPTIRTASQPTSETLTSQTQDPFLKAAEKSG